MTATAAAEEEKVKEKRQVGTLVDEAAPCSSTHPGKHTHVHKPTQTTSVMALHLFSLASLYYVI
jgi:hypothetical protein